MVSLPAITPYGRPRLAIRLLSSQLFGEGEKGEHVEKTTGVLQPYRHNLDLISSLHK
jgi:hypothetical protein